MTWFPFLSIFKEMVICEKTNTQLYIKIVKKSSSEILTSIMSSNKAMLDLLNTEDQTRVEDEMLTAELPDRRSSRNSTMYNPTSKASLPGRLTSRNRTIFMKDNYS